MRPLILAPPDQKCDPKAPSIVYAYHDSRARSIGHQISIEVGALSGQVLRSSVALKPSGPRGDMGGDPQAVWTLDVISWPF